MTAIRQDFEMMAGDDKRLEVTVLDEDDVVVNLTGASAIRWKLARSVRSAALVSYDLTDNIAIIDATAGRFNVNLDAADTESLKGLHYHEADIVDSTGKTGTVLYGTVTIRPSLVDPA